MERRVYLKRIFKGRDAVYSALKVLHAKYVEISVAKGHKKRTMSVAKILEEGIGSDERIRIYREIARQEKLGVTAKKAISAMMRGTYAARMSGAKAETWRRYYNDWKRHAALRKSEPINWESEGLNEGIKSSTCEQILSLLAKNPQTTQEELARTLGLSIRGIEYAIGTLKKAKRLRKVGGKRFGRWEIL